MVGAVRIFLKKTLCFLSLPLAVLLLAMLAVNHSSRQVFDGFKVGTDVRTVYAGDSHVEQCINDRLIPNSANIAQNGEVYYFTYFKVKKLLENNPAIDTLYLGFSYHSLSDYNDDFVFGEFSPYISAKYFFILPNSEKVHFLKENSKNLSLYLKNILRDGLGNSFFGGYENTFKNTTTIQKSMDKRMAFQFYKAGKLNGFSDFNMGYFDKIVQLCREKKVEPVLLSTPLAPYYKNKIPVEYRQKYAEALREYRLKVVDFDGLVLDDSCFIPDGDHVSEKGATIVSKHLASRGAGQ